MRIILAILFIGSGLVQAQTNYNGKVIWDWRKSPAAHNKFAQVIQETGMTKTQTIYLRAQQGPVWEGWYVSDKKVGTGANKSFSANQTQTVRIERVGKNRFVLTNPPNPRRSLVNNSRIPPMIKMKYVIGSS